MSLSKKKKKVVKTRYSELERFWDELYNLRRDIQPLDTKSA